MFPFEKSAPERSPDATSSPSSPTLSDMYSRSLETDRVLAGLTTVSGSGIVIRLDDSGLVQSLVHDSYLTEILNVLKGAGAQAISING